MHCKTNFGSLGKNEGSDKSSTPNKQVRPEPVYLRWRVAPQRCPLSSMTLQRNKISQEVDYNF